MNYPGLVNTNLRTFENIFIFGTRAQLIKLAPVIVTFENYGLNTKILFTNQHQETIDELIKEFQIKTEIKSLGDKKEKSTVTSLIRWAPLIYRSIRSELKIKDSKIVNIFVHGDTLSTLLGAIAGKNSKTRVIHLESGLTSNNFIDPFPEEIIRRVVFHLTDIAFCPDTQSLEFMREKYPRCRSFSTNGNTLLDALYFAGAQPNIENYDEYIVLSIHRFKNIFSKHRLEKIVELAETITKNFKVYFVSHPATIKRLNRYKLVSRLQKNTRITLLPRVGYSKFINLLSGASCVLSDGGSNQEELSALGIPTIILRETTEREDGLGQNVIMERCIPSAISTFILDRSFEQLRKKPKKPPEKSPSSIILEEVVKLSTQIA